MAYPGPWAEKKISVDWLKRDVDDVDGGMGAIYPHQPPELHQREPRPGCKRLLNL